MSDIIERLQAIGEPGGHDERVAWEAADEIKRLRAVLEKIENAAYCGNNGGLKMECVLSENKKMGE